MSGFKDFIVRRPFDLISRRKEVPLLEVAQVEPIAAISEDEEQPEAFIPFTAVEAIEPLMIPRLLGPRLEGLRYLLLGACQVGYLAFGAKALNSGADHMLYDSSAFTEVPVGDTSVYDAAVVGLVFRHIIKEAMGGELEFSRSIDEERARIALARCTDIINHRLQTIHEKLPTLPTFFLTFMEPSFNYFGNLANRFGVASPKGFMRRVNEALEESVSKYQNFYLLDATEEMSSIGLGRIHDDVAAPSMHVSVLGDFDEGQDTGRIISSASLTTSRNAHEQVNLAANLLMGTVADNVKILRGIDQVKLIIVDLDDTLWRGIAAEDNMQVWQRIEGWPMGFVESLLVFKQRGGLLAICSKNDMDATLDRLNMIWNGYISASDFASIKIGWNPKSEAIRDILAETNILAQNAVFIDDNPRELDEVKAQHPDIRCLGANHYDWRRIILRSPETQVPFVSAESRQRTELVRARIDREETAKTMSREEWLKSLEMAARVVVFNSPAYPDFARAVELINKTNQFNTTGRRWDLAEITAFLDTGGSIVTLSLRDKAVDNGIVGVALLRPGAVEQVVLSCRVFGLGVQFALGHVFTTVALKGAGVVRANIVDTGRNFACHGYYTALGFVSDDEGFVTHGVNGVPEWIDLSWEDLT